MDTQLSDQVARILREAAQDFILPRFQNLKDGETDEKEPGELVTIADREAEAHIAPKLANLIPGSRVVGEEAASQSPSLLDDLSGGRVWLLDPLDGTANFIAGKPDFAVMAALLAEGQIVASWIFHPISGQFAFAVSGGGAWLDGLRLKTRPNPPHAKPSGSVMYRFLPDDLKARIRQRADLLTSPRPDRRCAGLDYIDLANGNTQFLLPWRLLPWDHAPGVLLAQEAGAHVAHLDGSEYSPGDGIPGLLVAADQRLWTTLADGVCRSARQK